MNPEYQQIVDLFGLTVPVEEEQKEPQDSSPKGPEDIVRIAEQSLLAGDYERAAEYFERVLEQFPSKSVEARMGLATAMECLERSPQAVRQYAKVLKEQEKTAEAHLGLGEIYARHGKTDAAIRELEEAIKLEPDNGFYYLKLAEEFRKIGQRTKALKAAQTAVYFAPSESFYHYWMGDMLLELKQYEEALAAFRAAIELSPGDDFLYAQSSLAFWGAGRRVEAMKAVRLANDLNPEKYHYKVILAEFLRRESMIEEAELELKSVKKLDEYDKDLIRRMFVQAGISS